MERITDACRTRTRFDGVTVKLPSLPPDNENVQTLCVLYVFVETQTSFYVTLVTCQCNHTSLLVNMNAITRLLTFAQRKSYFYIGFC